MITVFYDGKCSLCLREIKYYKHIAPVQQINWLEVSEHIEELHMLRITEMDALRKLHVVDEDNQLHIGVEGFIKIWSKLPYWKLLAIVASFWPIKAILKKLYDVFAQRRYCRLYD